MAIDHTQLTQREQQVQSLIAQGLTLQQIAEALGLSYHTVRCYAASIRKRWHVSKYTPAASLAQKETVDAK
jgi:DNA-binding NarL/FixJ family response regulator